MAANNYPLEVKGLTKNYPSFTLKDISFALNRGQRLGILGPTGAGKSTLIKLLLRLYDPDEGSIRISGADIRTLPLDTLRRMFGVVFQNDAIFRGTIGDNVRLGREVSLAEMDRAIRDAQASFVSEKAGWTGKWYPGARIFRAASSSVCSWPARWRESLIS